MKLSNNLIVIDLETTGSHKFITEIGAVFLNKNLEIIDTFQILIKPEHPIEQEIESLTGITNDMVINAPLFPQAIKAFEEWVIKHSIRLKAVKLCAWGNYFDANVLRNLYKYYNMKYPFSGTWYDIKTIAAMWFMLSGRKQETLSVEKVINIMNIKLDAGRFHRADYDAMAEALILKVALGSLSNGFFLKSSSQLQNYTYLKINI